LTQNQTPVTTTEHKIGKVTYLVCSSASERATDTLDKKIKKLIRKDMELKIKQLLFCKFIHRPLDLRRI